MLAARRGRRQETVKTFLPLLIRLCGETKGRGRRKIICKLGIYMLSKYMCFEL